MVTANDIVVLVENRVNYTYSYYQLLCFVSRLKYYMQYISLTYGLWWLMWEPSGTPCLEGQDQSKGGVECNIIAFDTGLGVSAFVSHQRFIAR